MRLGSRAYAETDTRSDMNPMSSEINPAPTALAALELSIDIIASLRALLGPIRVENERLAGQLVRSAASVVTCLVDAFEREGRGRLRFLRMAAGRAEQTHAYLRIAEAWGWVQASELQTTFDLIEREMTLLWQLTQ
jgi:four helix bundle protein